MTGPGSRKWWALGALTLSVLAVGLDGTILSVAVPTLATALHATESDLQWFQSGYLLVLAAAMLPAGLLGDRLGRLRVRALGRRVHRGPGGARRGRLGRDRDGAVRADRAVHPGGAPARGERLGGGQLPGAARRPDPGRLAAVALLVGLGVPDE